MSTFKVGDRVVATEGSEGFFKPGDIGTVVAFDPKNGDVMVCFDDGQGVKQDTPGYESAFVPSFVKVTGREWWTGGFIKHLEPTNEA